MDRSMFISSSLETPNSPAKSCTRSLIKTYPLSRSRRVRHRNLQESPGEIAINDTDGRDWPTAERRAEHGRGGSLYETYTLGPQQRHQLVLTIHRRIARKHRQYQCTPPRRNPYLLHADHREPTSKSQAEEPQ
ncbi:MAG TPA: hypothetical protein VFW98_10370 [Gemmatimonadaceae bacterium]|nr:hypothetical protein [Gemmatimonadaceae bacterium]